MSEFENTVSGIRYLIDEYLESFMDEINSLPLRPFRMNLESTTIQRESEMNVNDRIISSIFNIRRSLENREDELETSITSNIMSIFTDVIVSIYGDEVAADGLEDVKVVVLPREFEKFPHYTVTSDSMAMYKEKECHVCLCPFELEEALTSLPCKHVFHRNCIYNWVCKQSSKCPVCRQDCRTVE
jgi:hypothetical protein